LDFFSIFRGKAKIVVQKKLGLSSVAQYAALTRWISPGYSSLTVLMAYA